MAEPQDVTTPVGLCRMAYDAAEYARERAECVALHLERGNVPLARRFLAELRRQSNHLAACITVLEASTNPQPEVTHG